MHRVALLIGVLGVAAVLTGGALAQEPNEVIEDLYASHPYDANPPGGMEAWHPMMQVLWQKHNEDEAKRMAGQLDFMGEGLTFDFMTGTQEFWFDDLKVKTTVQITHEASVLAVMNNGADQPYELYYGLIRDDDLGWQISEVWTDGDEGWRLSELIKETR